MSCIDVVRFHQLVNVYMNRYPGLYVDVDAELAWYKVRSSDVTH